jgi:cell division septum initiation protein DivIVA
VTDIAGRLTLLEEMVREAKSMPLSSSALVNREEVLEMLHEMQESLPEEIKQARWIVKDREELLAKAKSDADKIVEAARDEQLRMSRKQAIVARANEEAARVLSEAGDEAGKLRGDAEDYADTKLAQLEIALRRLLEDTQSAVRALNKTLDQVEVGRQRLRAPTAAQQEFAPEIADAEPPPQVYDEEEQS